jgi:hypothetical protein
MERAPKKTLPDDREQEGCHPESCVKEEGQRREVVEQRSIRRRRDKRLFGLAVSDYLLGHSPAQPRRFFQKGAGQSSRLQGLGKLGERQKPLSS